MCEIDDLVIRAVAIPEQYAGAYNILRAEADEFHGGDNRFR
jgi:hypothetical protein